MELASSSRPEAMIGRAVRPPGHGTFLLIAGAFLAGGAILTALFAPLVQCPNCRGDGWTDTVTDDEWQGAHPGDQVIAQRQPKGLSFGIPVTCSRCSGRGRLTLLKSWR